jgi:hypothetical protein
MMLVGCSFLFAQDGDKIVSGPKKGDALPKAFECMLMNGPVKPVLVDAKPGEGYYVTRPRCLVCAFALNPAVLIFTPEPAEGKDEAFNELVGELEKLADTELARDRSFRVGVVILSPDARDSTNNGDEKKAEELIKEAEHRQKLIKRLIKRTENLKHVVIAAYPQDGPIVRDDPPKGFKINPKAGATVVFYERMKVVENYAFAPGAFEAKDVEMIVKRVADGLSVKKK